jgi:hypothetical protein
MSLITTRSTAGGGATVKGLPLTNAEIDTNFINLNTDKLEATWTGNTTLVTLGTVTTGTWSATTIATTKGGTGLTSYATGDLTYASGSNTLAKLTKPAATSLLTMDAAGAPAWAALTATGITGLGTVTLGVWNGTTVATGYGGTGLTTFTSGGAVYATSTSALTTGTLPISAGGTNATTVAAAQSSLQVDPAGTAVALAIALG